MLRYQSLYLQYHRIYQLVYLPSTHPHLSSGFCIFPPLLLHLFLPSFLLISLSFHLGFIPFMSLSVSLSLSYFFLTFFLSSFLSVCLCFFIAFFRFFFLHFLPFILFASPFFVAFFLFVLIAHRATTFSVIEAWHELRHTISSRRWWESDKRGAKMCVTMPYWICYSHRHSGGDIWHLNTLSCRFGRDIWSIFFLKWSFDPNPMMSVFRNGFHKLNMFDTFKSS